MSDLVPRPILKVVFEPTAKQDLAWQLLLDLITTELLFGGGAGGGKSYLGCFWIIYSALKYSGSRWLLGRSVLSNLKKSTLLTLFDVFKEFGLKKGNYNYNQQDNVITLYNGSQIYLVDLDYYPSDPNYDRLGSMEFTGGFIDEANQITARAKDVVKSRIRYKLDAFGLIPKLLMTCNPAKNWVYTDFYKPFKTGTLSKGTAFIQALAKDNPHNSPHYLESLKNLKDKILRERLWFGNWEYDDDENALFHIDNITDLFTNSIDDGEKYITADIARLGRDRTVIMVWSGLKVIEIKVYDKNRIDEANDILDTVSTKHQVPRSRELVDEDGVGGGVVDYRKCKGFVGNSSPIQDKFSENKVNYLNLRSQCFYTLADVVRESKMAIRTNNLEYQQFITEELEQIKARDVDKDSKLRIISKDEIKQHLGRSPDFADSLMMRMWFEVNKLPEPKVMWI